LKPVAIVVESVLLVIMPKIGTGSHQSTKEKRKEKIIKRDPCNNSGHL
jgi:hypothetical protein